MISQISIQNVKGYGIPGKTLDIELFPTKVNLCVASNGFGKSSLATAFKGLKARHLEVKQNDKHVHHSTDESSISICMDSKIYHADRECNEISKVLETYVINNRIYADSKKKKTPYATHVESYINISDVHVCEKKTQPSHNKYKISDIQSHFGKNGRLLCEITPLLEYIAKNKCFAEILHMLNKFATTQKRANIVNNVLVEINSIDSKITDLITLVPDSLFDSLEGDKYYAQFHKTVAPYYSNKRKLNVFCDFFQLLYLYKNRRTYLEEQIDYLSYVALKNCLDENLRHLNTSFMGLRTSVENGSLVIKFPKAELISNGQRDVMTCAAELIIFQAFINPRKKYLLIIDEVFDYLDDANVMAAQYFLSDILSKYKGKVYIMLLTHLNPYCFRNYVFSPKVINPVFLDNSQAKSNKQMMRFISFREGLDKKLPSNKELYDSLSLNLFHYTPNPINLTQDITEASDGKQGIKTSWGNCKVLKEYLIQEINKYFSIDTEYDPYAVALALRLRVEKLAYQKLPTEELKEAFLNTHTTKAKFEFCENHNVSIPPVYYMVNAIHNDADHLKYDSLNDKFQERNTVYKLQNGVIKKIMQEVFEYKGQEVLLSSI